jgi:hypothetical protein
MGREAGGWAWGEGGDPREEDEPGPKSLLRLKSKEVKEKSI